MGHHAHTPVETDPQAVAAAETTWHDFTKLTKVSVIAVIVILAGMAVFLL